MMTLTLHQLVSLVVLFPVAWHCLQMLNRCNKGTVPIVRFPLIVMFGAICGVIVKVLEDQPPHWIVIVLLGAVGTRLYFERRRHLKDPSLTVSH